MHINVVDSSSIRSITVFKKKHVPCLDAKDPEPWHASVWLTECVEVFYRVVSRLILSRLRSRKSSSSVAYSVQLQLSEDSDTFSACRGILVFA